MEIRDTLLHGAKLIYPDVFVDRRGYFKEVYHSTRYGLGFFEFVQDSISFSARKDTLRGLHGDPEMSKLVQVLQGEVWDVMVDLRKESPTYRQWQSFLLSDSNHRQLYIPRRFLHGFLTLTNDVVFSYKQGAYYNPDREITVRWDDPVLKVAWPFNGEPIISERDSLAPYLGDMHF